MPPNDPRYPIPQVGISDEEADAVKRNQQSIDAYRALSAKEPAPAKGARAVGGTIATVLGSLVNPQIGNLLNSRILHPGQEQWQTQMEAAKRDMEANDLNMRRVSEVQRIRDAAQARSDANAARIAANEDRDAARAERAQQNYAARQKMLLDQGGEIIPNGIRPQNKRVTLDNPAEPPSVSNLPMSKTLMIPGMPAENMFDEAANKTYGQQGAVQEITGPEGARSTVMIPNRATVQARKEEDLRKVAQIGREEKKKGEVPVPGWLIQKSPDQFKPGDTISQDLLDKLTLAQGKPAPRQTPEQQFIDEYQKKHPGSTLAQAQRAYEENKRLPPQPSPPPRGMAVGPDRKVIEVGPGTVLPEGSQTLAGFSTSNTPTAQSRSMAEMAKTVVAMTPDLLSQVDALNEKIGPAAGRWNEFWVKGVGADDPAFAGLDQDLDLYASALVRTHFGGRGGQGYREALKKDFRMAQSPEDLKSRIQHADKWLQGYAAMANSPAAGGAPAASHAVAPATDIVEWTRDKNGKPIPVKK